MAEEIVGPTLSLGLDASGAEEGASVFTSATDRIAARAKAAEDSLNNLNKEISEAASSGTAATSGLSKFDQETAKLRAEALAATAASESLSTELRSTGESATTAAQGLTGAQAAMVGFVGGITSMLATRVLDFFISTAKETITVGDAYSRLDARLKLVTGSTEAATKAHADLLGVSNRIGVSFESTGQFFARLASQSKELGLSYEQMVTVTESLEGAFKLGGSSAEETSRAMLQLGQSFSSGKFQGEEFRAVAENAPVVLDLLAESLGVTRGQLLEMSQSGKLTAQALAEGLLTIAPDVAARVQEMGGTVAEAGVRMQNAWNELLVELNKTGGVTEAAISAINALTAAIGSSTFHSAVSGAIGIMKDYFNVIGQGIAGMRAYSNAIAEMAGARDVTGEKLRALPGAAVPPPVTTAEARATLAQRQQESLQSGMSQAEVPGLLAAIAKQPLLPKEPKGRAAPKEKDVKIPLDAKPFEDELAKLNQLSEDSTSKTEKDAKALIDSISKANLQAHGNTISLIDDERKKQLDAINLAALSVQEKADLRVKVEDTASQKIQAIRQREAQFINSLEEQSLKSHGRTQDAEDLAREHKRQAQLQSVETSGLNDADKEKAKALINDINRPITGFEKVGLQLQQFGDGLTSVEGTTQLVIQGISSLGATATSAFADAILEGGKFSDVLDSLGKSLAKMAIQMAMQLAMQQALGGASTGLAALFGAGSGGPVAGSTGTQVGTAAIPFAKGGMVRSEIPSGIYTQPTLFPMKEPGFRQYAGGTGLMGEAGPEAVLPLTRGPGGKLGVAASGGGGGDVSVPINVIVNNSSKANVRTEQRDNAQGGKDVLLTIADQVENIVASRVGRSGTRVNRSISTVGQTVAR